MDVNEDELVDEPLEQVPEQAPTDEDCMGRRSKKRDGERVFVGYCRSTPGRGTDHVGEGRCKHHGGAGGSGGAREGAGAPEGNTNAVTHAAYSESFVEDFLTEGEIERVDQAQELLDSPAGAQDHARLMASIAVEQYRRSGDERFLRRYEAICDKAGIFPDDELTVTHEGLEDAFMSNLKDYHEDE